MAQLYIAAAHKSSGKTSLSVGLAAALAHRGLNVQTFKKGPDYIDPLWLANASGKPCYNLDFFTQSRSEILATFSRHSSPAGFNLIEGNKGLYDGLDVAGSDSNAALAKLLAAPVVLVIDCTGMTRGIAPLVLGYRDFEPVVNIGGVILNKVGGTRHEHKLRAALEHYTNVQVIGALGRDSRLEIPERHLGLIPANEAAGALEATAMIRRLSNAVADAVNLSQLIDIADTAGLPDGIPHGAHGTDAGHPPLATPAAHPATPRADVRIAIARDAAFGFYYPDDLEAFALAGAELVPFDTLVDSHLPPADGLFIGGGFPETQLEALATNQDLMNDIRATLAAGMPAYAECGGLMYLARSISWHGRTREMVGSVLADVIVAKHPQGRGYMRLQETSNSPWPPARNQASNPDGAPAHEFHYARLENLAAQPVFAQRVVRGTGIDGQHDGLVIGNLLTGFAHHRNTLANPWVGRFVEFVRQNKRENSNPGKNS